jgi:hypothetical protein
MFKAKYRRSCGSGKQVFPQPYALIFLSGMDFGWKVWYHELVKTNQLRREKRTDVFEV